VLAGAGGYNTSEVIELARELERMGVDGILSVTPYYNKPTQEACTSTISHRLRHPPAHRGVQRARRTGVNIEPATMARLAAIEIRGRERGFPETSGRWLLS